MKLVDEWQWVLKRAWSVRLLIIATLLTCVDGVLQAALALGWNPWLPPGVLTFLAGIVSAAALVARFVVQKRDDE